MPLFSFSITGYTRDLEAGILSQKTAFLSLSAVQLMYSIEKNSIIKLIYNKHELQCHDLVTQHSDEEHDKCPITHATLSHWKWTIFVNLDITPYLEGKHVSLFYLQHLDFIFA